ncbi:low-affinity Zn(2+) transporter zrt2 [Recurvomyces mirabilis]|nr:low-affinity Zn(2+) transporter zrt2 [Recurvomyces mirabilis]
MIGSFLGAWFPVFAARHKGVAVPGWAFFIAKYSGGSVLQISDQICMLDVKNTSTLMGAESSGRASMVAINDGDSENIYLDLRKARANSMIQYFGSGVIVATAFIHLLAPANAALTDPCLTGPITQYSWVEGICLIVIFAMFILEFMAMRYATFGHSHSHSHEYDVEMAHQAHSKKHDKKQTFPSSAEDAAIDDEDLSSEEPCAGPHVPGDDHLSHGRNHNDVDHDHNVAHQRGEKTFDPDSYAAQMTAIAILEFGVIFHSIFIGLTLAVAGAEFTTLYVVLAFHQTFEGLALGTRLASIKWPSSSRWTPYVLGFCYALSTPIAIAVGLGIRTHFAPGSQTTLIVNGVFDSISAGILIYTGLIELMAHEFMFSEYMQKAPISEVLSAIGCMCLGAGLMALLGKWA